jgi:hypothetical protein
VLVRIAHRNLLHDRRRFVARLASVAFSVMLVVVQLGLFVGLAANASHVPLRRPRGAGSSVLALTSTCRPR